VTTSHTFMFFFRITPSADRVGSMGMEGLYSWEVSAAGHQRL
jgi:hypothetical protein